MITSTANEKVKQLLKLQKKGKARKEAGVFIAEGLRMFRETPSKLIREIYATPGFATEHRELLKQYQQPVAILEDHVFTHVSDTKTPQGILAVVQRPSYRQEQIFGGPQPHLLLLEGLQDPGNVGTIFRTAEGAGVTGIILSDDSVDVYNPKVIRSTMGSIYRVPFCYEADMKAVLEELKKRQIQTFAAHLKGQHSYDQEDYRQGIAFLLGNEGAGLSAELSDLADTWVQIPMAGQVESLNVGIAAAVLMFEAARQRRG